MDIKNKVAFVTGGASGIGLGIAKVLAGEGARVIIADLREDHLKEAMAKLKAMGKADAVTPIKLDVTDRAAFKAVADDMDKRFGGIDILINNAGVGVEGPFRKATYADWDFGIGVNIGGVVNGLQTFLPRMLARGRGGHIVNTASLAPMVVMPSHLAIYTATKAAVISLTEAIRADLGADNIGVSVLCPGFVKSNIHEARQNRPAHLRDASGFADAEEALAQRQVGDNWMEPEAVGHMVADAIRENRLYIITHGEFTDRTSARMQAIMDATPEAGIQL